MDSGAHLRGPWSSFLDGRKNIGKSFMRRAAASRDEGGGGPYKPSSPGVQEATGSAGALSTPLCAWGHGGGYIYGIGTLIE